MRTIAATAVIAVALLAGCSQAKEAPASRDAAADARRACKAANINPGDTPQPTGRGINPGDSDSVTSAQEAVGWAADAAALDGRWSSLAHAMKTAVSQMTLAKAEADRTGLPAVAPDQKAITEAANTAYTACARAYDEQT